MPSAVSNADGSEDNAVVVELIANAVEVDVLLDALLDELSPLLTKLASGSVSITPCAANSLNSGELLICASTSIVTFHAAEMEQKYISSIIREADNGMPDMAV